MTLLASSSEGALSTSMEAEVRPRPETALPSPHMAGVRWPSFSRLVAVWFGDRLLEGGRTIIKSN